MDHMMTIEAGERQYELVEGWGPHCIWVDPKGDLYVGEVLEGSRLQEFARSR